MKQLYPQQKKAVSFLLKALHVHGGALNSSETGTGKTLMSVEIARELAPPAVLVVCPKSVIVPWQRAFAEQGLPVPGVVNYELLRTGNTPWVSRPAKKNFTFRLPPGSLVIWDESHKLKNWKSLNCAMSLSAIRSGHRNLFLSATPFRDPTEMKAHGVGLRLFSENMYWDWAIKAGCCKGDWNELYFPDDNEAAKERLSEISRQMYADRAYRLTRRDLGEHFSKCSIDWTPRDFGDSGRIAKALTAVQDAFDDLLSRKLSDGPSPEYITKLLRARQEVELLKLPGIAEQAQEGLEGGMSVFITLCFRESVSALRKLFGEAPVSIVQGGQSQTARQAEVDRFQRGETRICIANIAAGGVGISLHDEHGGRPRLALISPSYDEKELRQALGRVDRAAAKTDTVQRIMVAAGTIEEKVLNRLKEKLALSDLTHSAADDRTQHAAPAAELKTESKKMPDTQEAQPAHATFGPSALKYYASCGGYVPTSGDNEASLLGTRVHLALETDDDSPLQSDEEALLASWCRRAVTAIHHREEIIIGDHDLREIRLKIWALGEETFGTCDRLSMPRSKRRAVAMDYKTGRGAIDKPRENWQAKAYTIGVFQKYPEVQEVAFYFICPRRDEILYGLFQRSELPALLAEVSYVLRRARLTRAAADKGEYFTENFRLNNDVCKYCARISQGGPGCPKWNGVAKEAVRRHDPEFDFPQNDTVMTEAEAAAMLRAIPVLEKVIEGWKATANRMVFGEGRSLPGFEIKERSGKRSITSVEQALRIAKQFGVAEADFIAAVPGMPVTKWELLISKAAPKGEKKSAVEQALQELYAAGGISQGEETQFLAAEKA